MSQSSPFIRLERSPTRADWVQRVEASGLVWHGQGADAYWNETEHLALTLQAAETLKSALLEQLSELQGLTESQLVEQRYATFRRMGRVLDSETPITSPSS